MHSLYLLIHHFSISKHNPISSSSSSSSSSLFTIIHTLNSLFQMVSATATLFSYNFTDHHILSPFPTIPKSFIGLCKPFHSRLPTSIHLHFTPSSFIVRAVIKWRCPKQIHPPNCDRGFQKKVLYLESIGIDSFSLIENHPMLISASLSDIKSTVEYMTSMDFTAIEFRRIVGMCPEILTTKLSDVIPVFTFLLREAHVKGSDIKHAINRRPRLLVCSVDKQLRPTLYFLQSIGIEEGCDASILLDDSNDDKNRSAEKQAIPNQTLRGFDKIDMIKEELEQACPGVVSCADILALATRDAVLLAGGPFYPVLTGRKDSHRSFFEEATNQIPRPDDNVTRTLHLFGLKGFNERETVSLLGGHNIGKIGCDFIHPRLYNFMGTGQPDPSIPHDFLLQMWLNCPNNITTTTDEFPDFVVSKRMSSHSDLGMSYMQALSASVSSGAAFDTHYYQSLLRGRGLLFADQQLMAAEKTARLVSAYSSDDGSTFRTDFARVMLKMSNLDVLSGLQGQVRLNCSQPVSS